MQGLQGDAFPDRGVHRDVAENARRVVTDAETAAWAPPDKPFTTLIVTFAAVGGCRCAAVARHRSAADREAHQAMGLHKGLGASAPTSARRSPPRDFFGRRPVDAGRKVIPETKKAALSGGLSRERRTDHMRWRR